MVGAATPSANIGTNEDSNAVNNDGDTVVLTSNGYSALTAQFYNASGILVNTVQVLQSGQYLNKHFQTLASASADGDFVFAWFDTTSNSIQIASYTAAGIATGMSTSVNVFSYQFALSATADGGFDLAYTNKPTGATTENVYLAQYSGATNSWITSPSSPIDVGNGGASNDSITAVQMAAASDGDLAVEWMYGPNGSSHTLEAVQYTSSVSETGLTAGAPILIASYSAGLLFTAGAFTPTIALDGSGGFVTAWPQFDSLGRESQNHGDLCGPLQFIGFSR